MTAPQAAVKKPPTHDPRCGTKAGYMAHYRRDEGPCDPCKDANNAARPERPRRREPRPPVQREVCGTSEGGSRHSKNGERWCAPCRQARSEKLQSRRPSRPERPHRDALLDAACWPAVEVAPGVMLHDTKHTHETTEEWNARYLQARAVCDRCPVREACRQLDAHYKGQRNGVDGILDGRPTSSPLYTRKELV